MSGRLRLEPRNQTTQKLSTKLVKYAGVSLAALALVASVILIYSNLAGSEESLAGADESTYADKALKFDGNNDYVSLGKVNGSFSNKFTIMAWAKWNVTPSTGNQWANIYTINSTSSSDEGIFWMQHNQDNSKFEFAVETSSGRTYIQSQIQPKKDFWYHLAGVYDGSTIKLYVNGVLEGSVNHSGNIPNPGSDYTVTVGQWAHSDNNYRRFTGTVDEVSAWDYAMSVTDIRKYMTTKVPEKESGLIMNFPFDEGSGTKLSSTKNSKYKGTINGASWVESGAPVSAETKYIVKNGQKKYTHTFSNGYTMEISNMSKDPEAVLFYFREDNSDLSLELNFLDYIFPGGIMGAYVIDRSTITYESKFTVASKGNSSGKTETQKNILLTRTAGDATTWASQTFSSISLFTLVPQSPLQETAIGELSSVLPIVLEYFKGNNSGEGVLLEWATASEDNNDFFTIERSTDGKEFNNIERIPGAGNSKSRLTYSTVDKNPKPGTNYYRLKQTDYDGKFDYSEIISVVSDKEETTGFVVQNVYPNPFVDKLKVNLVAADGPVIITFANASGNIVQQESLDATQGENTYEINASARLEKGMYLVTFMQPGHEPRVVRVMKN